MCILYYVCALRVNNNHLRIRTCIARIHLIHTEQLQCEVIILYCLLTGDITLNICLIYDAATVASRVTKGA